MPRQLACSLTTKFHQSGVISLICNQNVQYFARDCCLNITNTKVKLFCYKLVQHVNEEYRIRTYLGYVAVRRIHCLVGVDICLLWNFLLYHFYYTNNEFVLNVFFLGTHWNHATVNNNSTFTCHLFSRVREFTIADNLPPVFRTSFPLISQSGGLHQKLFRSESKTLIIWSTFCYTARYDKPGGNKMPLDRLPKRTAIETRYMLNSSIST